MRIIVGLGNPGQNYQNTRHNVGFMALDRIAEHWQLTWREDKKWNALVAEWQGDLLVKPLTFMNLSGDSVQKIIAFYQLFEREGKSIKPEQDLADKLIVIQDDIDLPLGSYKRAVGSSSAGHNGIKSIIEKTGTKQFTRYRIGVKTEELGKVRLGIFKTTPAKFVLARFNKNELEQINKEIELIIKEL